MKRLLALLLLSCGTARASVIPVSPITGGIRENFDELSLGSATQTGSSGMVLSFVPDAAVVRGAVDNRYAAPFTATGPDATPYLSTGSSGSYAGASVRMALPGSYTYFRLLWGSVDAYNTLAFYSGGRLVGSVSGGDILANPNGYQGSGGSLSVGLMSDTPFDTVVASSTQYAFELDDVSFSRAIAEPVSLSLLAGGVLGLGVMRRRR